MASAAPLAPQAGNRCQTSRRRSLARPSRSVERVGLARPGFGLAVAWAASFGRGNAGISCGGHLSRAGDADKILVLLRRRPWVAAVGAAPPPPLPCKAVCQSAAARRPASGVAAIFAPDPDLLLHGAIGEAEEHAFAVRLVHDGAPARQHENVLRPPFQRHVVDARAPSSLHGDKHRSIGGAIAACLEAL